MNKKGFTLIEILGVIVILTVITIITVFSINAIQSSTKKSLLETKVESIEKSAIIYGQEHYLTEQCEINGETISCLNITIGKLIDSNYYTSTEVNGDNNQDLINNVTGLSMRDDTIRIYRKNNRITASISCFKSNNETC